MTLQSLDYFIFLTVLWTAYLLIPGVRPKQFLLLSASVLFYWLLSPSFLILLLGASTFNFLWSRVLAKKTNPARLWLGITANLMLLVFFKSAAGLLNSSGVSSGGAEWILPVGLSFYTFQAISWQIDVYRGSSLRPEFLEFLLYMSLWATISSGPICRVPEMVPQFRSLGRPDLQSVGSGLRRIVVGLFLKLVLADTLALGLSPGRGIGAGFDQPGGYQNALDVVFLCLGYGLQIFFDFAGYTHVALGSALLFGLSLRENFNAPFSATNLSEFWNRWHMSLSSWIRDYLFFPLAALRPSVAWRTFAVVVSMTAFGAWHGASLNFALWGLFHGIGLAAHRLFQQLQRRLKTRVNGSGPGQVVGWFVTLSWVTLGWTLFRASDLGQTFRLLAELTDWSEPGVVSNPFRALVLVLGFGCLAFWRLHDVYLKSEPLSPGRRILDLAAPACLLTLLILSIAWGDQESPFVYVRF